MNTTNTLQPYDCGVFFTRSVETLFSVFQNPNAAYLASGPSSIPTPLNMGLENSRRFRALPVYAVLLAYGRDELAEMFARQVRLARSIANFIHDSEGYDLLAQGPRSAINQKAVTPLSNFRFEDTHVIVIFRARDDSINAELVKRINATRKIYVSGTQWDGKPACRFAISTWKVDVERDSRLIKEVLESILDN
jgi:glutamate/tyrosine decarboxylase-like PLP-dependent enzyme